jgi:hypothetical protein
MKYLVNSFSFNMVQLDREVHVTASPLTIDAARAAYTDDVVSAIGHADTAAVVAGLLGRAVPANRATLTLRPGDELLLAQYTGPRLPEGATSLPAGARIDFLQVLIQ